MSMLQLFFVYEHPLFLEPNEYHPCVWW